MAAAGTPWQLERETMEHKCGYLLTSGQWADCTFMVGSETDETAVPAKDHLYPIPAHKLVLAMSSPVFEAMFYGGLSENNDAIVEIPDVQPEAFKALLQYIYTGNTDIGSFEMAWDLWYGAKKYMLPHLVNECNRYICSVLGPMNACRAYEFACLFDEKTLMDNCIKIISTNTKAVLNDSSFLDVELNTLMTVFSLDQLNVDSELDLFHAVVRYAKAKEHRTRGQISPHVVGQPPSEELSEKGLLPSVHSSSQTSLVAELDSKPPTKVVTSEPNADKENLKEVDPTIRGMLQKIRFLSLTLQQFEEGPARSGLLTKDESFAIIMNIASTVSAVPMPTGFSKCRERRQQPSDSVNEGPLASPRLKPCSESRRGAATKLTTPAEIVRGLLSHEREILEDAARAALHMTCDDVQDDTSENLTQLVAAGAILPLVAALHHSGPGIQYDAAWALTNIACDGEHAVALVNADAVPALVGLLGRGGAVAEQAAWALGNIAGGGDTTSDAIMDAGAGPALLEHMQPSTPSAPLATYLRTYRILCQHIKKFELVSPALPYIENLLVLADQQVLAEACWVLYHLGEGVILNQELFTPSHAMRLTALMGHAAPRVQAAAIGAVKNMLGPSPSELIDRCFHAGFLGHLMNLLKCGNPSIVKDAAYVAAGFLQTQPRIQQALDEGILEPLGLIITEGNNTCKLYAGGAIGNLCCYGSPSQLRMLAEAAALKPFCRLLAAGGITCLYVLRGLTALLKTVKENTKLALLSKLREVGVPQLLMTVHLDSDEQNRKYANHLLRIHFLNE